MLSSCSKEQRAMTSDHGENAEFRCNMKAFKVFCNYPFLNA